MDKVFIDFETRSTLDLTKVGAAKYFADPKADLICMSYNINPPPYGDGVTKLWLPRQPLPFDPFESTVYAFNALFEYRAWNVVGKRRYLFPDLPLSNMIDIMALGGRYTYFQKLEQLATVLGLPINKDPLGKQLIKKITQPPFQYTEEELHQFYRYCLQDTEVEIACVNALPADHLSEEEQKTWELTQRMNLRGLPVDDRMIQRVYAVAQYAKDKAMKGLPDLTGGEVCAITQTVKIAQWVSEQGVDMPDCKKETVAKLLECDDLQDTHPEVYRLLELRQEYGLSSIAKYRRLIDQSYHGRIYDNLRYYGTSTGRWSGMGFQAHNLPRATVEDIEGTINKFYDTSILREDPMYCAKALIRSSVTAPEGKVLGIADYKSIENRIIAWVAGEERVVDLHRKGLDEYKDFAASLYQVKYDDVDKDQRFLGKVVTLGAGYNLSAAGLVKYAESYGLEISINQGTIAINTYRRDHPKIVKMWWNLKSAAMNAIQNPGQVFSVNDNHFRVVRDRNRKRWMVLTLVSGRNLFYSEPEIRDDSFGPIPTHMGINSYNKKWQRLKLIPGRIIENIVQALARDVLAHGKKQLEQHDYEPNLSVHDEVVVEMDEAKADIKEIERIICINPPWCPDLPLGAEGVLAKRYYKI